MKNLFLIFTLFITITLNLYSQAPLGYYNDDCESFIAFSCVPSNINFRTSPTYPSFLKGVILNNNPGNSCNFPNAVGVTWSGLNIFHSNSFEIKGRAVFRQAFFGATYKLRVAIYNDCSCVAIASNTSSTVVTNPNAVFGAVTTILSTPNLPCGKYYIEFACSRTDSRPNDTTAIIEVSATPMTPSLFQLPSGITINKSTTNIFNVCASSCPFKLEVDPIPNGFCPEYEWYDDNDKIGTKSFANIDVNTPGQKEILVNLFLGNNLNGAICDQELIRIKVNVTKDPALNKRRDLHLCSEEIREGRYFWHGKRIVSEGEYITEFEDSRTCCKFDSILNVIDLDQAENNHHIFVANTSSAIYTDPFTKKTFLGCRYQEEITRKFQYSNRLCDSLYRLTTIYPVFTTKPNISINNNLRTINPNIEDVTDICNTKASITYDYYWYKNNDTSQVVSRAKILTTDQHVDFCIKLKANIVVDNRNFRYDTSFCYNIVSTKDDSNDSRIYSHQDKNTIYITLPEGESISSDSNIKLYSLVGSQIAASGSSIMNKVQLHIGDLLTGIYIVKIKTKQNQNYLIKFIKY
jgi:hypothetical protein